MVNCDKLKSHYCNNACCFLDVSILESELNNIGEENVQRIGHLLYLHKNPRTDACVFLDVNNKKCSIYDKIPNSCRDYDCSTPYELPGSFIKEVTESLEKS
jgi:Fe-S-cluster containining protein